MPLHESGPAPASTAAPETAGATIAPAAAPGGRSRVNRGVLVVIAGALLLHGYSWFLEDYRPNLRWLWRDAGAIVTYPTPPLPDTAVKAQRFGWYAAWADQSYYYGEARDLARFDLPGANLDPLDMAKGDTKRHRYLYGLGYPLLAVPMIWLGFRGDPYLLVNAGLYVVAMALTYVIARRVLRPPWPALAVLAAMLSPLTRLMAQPWSTSVTVVGVLVAVLIALLDDERANRWPIALALGAVTSLTFSARYVDVAFPLASTGVSMLPALPARRDRRDLLGAIGRRWRLLVATSVTLAVTLGLTLWSHQVAYGVWRRTPYGEQARNLNVQSPWLLWRAPRQFLEVFVTARTAEGTPLNPLNQPIVRAMPWLVLVPLGIYVLTRLRSRDSSMLFRALLVSVAGTIMYCSWFASGGDNLVFLNTRFWICWFPLWAIAAALAGQWLTDRARARDPEGVPGGARAPGT